MPGKQVRYLYEKQFLYEISLYLIIVFVFTAIAEHVLWVLQVNNQDEDKLSVLIALFLVLLVRATICSSRTLEI